MIISNKLQLTNTLMSLQNVQYKITVHFDTLTQIIISTV